MNTGSSKFSRGPAVICERFLQERPPSQDKAGLQLPSQNSLLEDLRFDHCLAMGTVMFITIAVIFFKAERCTQPG